MTLKTLQHGIYGSLVGGVIFGAMMGMMGMLPMIGAMVGLPSVVGGFVVHLMISAVIGVGFVLTVTGLGRAQTAGVVAGLLYGFVWWVLGPLTLMPLGMGMGLGVNWTLSAATAATPSLVGHLVFGAALGATFRWLQADTGRVPGLNPQEG